MNERGKENLSGIRKKEIVKKQKRIRSCNRTHVRNDLFIFVDIYITEEIRDH